MFHLFDLITKFMQLFFEKMKYLFVSSSTIPNTIFYKLLLIFIFSFSP